MANIDRPMGARPLNPLCKARPYVVESSYGTALHVGDPVVISGTSAADPRDAATLLPAVNRASTSSTITGFIVGIAYASSNVTAPDIPTKNYIAASTGGVVMVADDPDELFVMQEDSDASNIAATDVGEFCDLVITDGNTTTGLSNCELDSSDAGTGDNVRIVRLHNAVNNEVGANADWVIQINEHTYKGVSTPK